jgi:hypothetical protein
MGHASLYSKAGLVEVVYKWRIDIGETNICVVLAYVLPLRTAAGSSKHEGERQQGKNASSEAERGLQVHGCSSDTVDAVAVLR